MNPSELDNVTRLRNAGVIPQDVTLTPAYEAAINDIDPDDLDVVLRVHEDVGPMEFPLEGPIGRLLIF